MLYSRAKSTDLVYKVGGFANTSTVERVLYKYYYGMIYRFCTANGGPNCLSLLVHIKLLLM